MRVPTILNNSRIFRLCWWIICIPLELFRLCIVMPIAGFIYLLTVRNVTRAWAALWMLIHFEILTIQTFPVPGNTFDELFIIGGLFLLFTNWIGMPLRHLIRFILTPHWRLGVRSQRKKLEQQAKIIIKAQNYPPQDRASMTRRLSPELQNLLASA